MNKILYYFAVFIIGSFLGWIIETIWCLIKNKHYESRKGLIYSPLTPVYGVGAMVVEIIVNILNIRKNIFKFLVGVIASTIIEYLFSFLQEKIFSSKSWDYRQKFCNINGRVNLTYSLFFGLISLIWCKYINPVVQILAVIDTKISLLLMLFVSYDVIISGIASYRMKERHEKKVRKGNFWKYIDNKYNDKRMLKVFANMQFID